MDRDYLKKLIGFVTSRQTEEDDGMYNGWLAYYNRVVSYHKIKS